MKENKKAKKIICITVLIVLVVFLIGNGVAYSKWKTNIFSWVLEKTKAKDNNVEAEPEKVSLNTYSSVLEKIGIQKEYDEIKTNVNQAVENNGVRITLLDCGYDSNRFIVGYKVEDLEGKIKAINEKYKSKLTDDVASGDIYDSMIFWGEYTFYTDKGQKEVNPDENMGAPNDSSISEQISDTEFVIYDTVTISEINWDGKITDVDINLKVLSFLGREDDIRGNWGYKVTELDDKYADISICLLDVHKRIDNKLTINSIRIENTGIFGNIYINYPGKDEDDRVYLFKIVNKNNKRLGEFCLAMAEDVTEPKAYKYLSKLEENEEYKILVYNNENYDDIQEGKVQPIYTIPFIYQNNIHNYQPDDFNDDGFLLK